MERDVILAQYAPLIGQAIDGLGIMLAVVDEAGQLIECNHIFRQAAALDTHRENASFVDLVCESDVHCLSAIAVGNARQTRLRLRSGSPEERSFMAWIAHVPGRYLILGQRPYLSDDEILEQMSALNNELMNLSRELKRRNRELEEAQERINTLSGLIPICASCKKIRDDQGYWQQVEVYVSRYTDAMFSHAICPDCMRRLYGDLMDEGEQQPVPLAPHT